MSNGDSYKRRMISENEFQCGCHWTKDPVYGDVLVECPIHEQATMASVRKHEREGEYTLTCLTYTGKEKIEDRRGKENDDQEKESLLRRYRRIAYGYLERVLLLLFRY